MNVARLFDLLAQLRHPETGCSWDLQQDFQSLAPHTVEEAYEVADAIERGDYQDLCAELGDLLWNVVFYAHLAEQQGLFTFDGITDGIASKLIRRHPHVFGDAFYANDAERRAAWEAAKHEERQQKAASDAVSVLDDIPRNLPALSRCEKTQDRAAHVGFDWPEAAPVFDKVEEELAEVKQAWQSGDADHTEEEIGDLLLVVVNLARHLNVNSEQALKRATEKFSRRFRFIEQAVQQDKGDFSRYTLAELDVLWRAVKQQEPTR
ncbi:MAG: nucleoside triphosphate pyrophosphohydrolase [Methylococcales bacterium]|nr:nucleoside triphosphate pyrophosphohydrolase [Methylococcales bacterium]